MQKLIITIIFVVLAIFYGQAQDGLFQGKVINKNTQELLFGANLVLLNNPAIGGFTDINGYFQISCPAGDHKFVISYMGMIKDTIQVIIISGETVEKTIALISEYEELDEMEVTAGKFNHKVSDMIVSMEVIKPDIIEERNTRSVETILDQTPGINILDGEPQIRGGSGFTFGVGSKVAVLVDDMPMLSGDAGRPEWGFIPIENIEQIEVIKGASSVLSGASALSGSISIKTAEPGINPLTKISVFSGLYSQPENNDFTWWKDVPYISGAHFLHTRKVGNLDIEFGGMLNFDHGYIGAPIPCPFVIDSISNFSDNQMKSEKARINFGLRYHSEKLSRLTYGIRGNTMYNKTNIVLAWLDDSTGLFRAYPGGVMLQKQIIANLDPFVVFYSKNKAKHMLNTRFWVTDNTITNNQSNHTFLFYGDYQYKQKFEALKDVEFIGGISSSQVLSHAQLYRGSGSPDNELLNLSTYGQLEKKIMDRLNLSMGYRLEYYSLNQSSSEGAKIFRGGLNYEIRKGTNIRMSYGQGFRYPTIAERFIKTSVGTFGVFDNPDLLPETSWNLEAGFRQGYKFGDFYGYLDVAAYKQVYNNTIEYLFGFWDSTYTFAMAGFKFLNTGKSQVLGTDASFVGVIELSKKSSVKFMIGYNYILPTTLEPDIIFAKDFNPGGSGDFSYNTTSLDTTGQILKYRFLHTFKGDIDVSVHKLSTGISVRYFSRIQNLDKAIVDFEQATANTGGSLQEVRYVDYYNNHKKGNLIIDARLSYAFNKIHKLSIVVNNLLNRTYSLRPLKIEPMRTIMLQYSVYLN